MNDKQKKPKIEKLSEDTEKALTHERPDPETTIPTTRPTSQSQNQEVTQSQQEGEESNNKE